MNARFSFYAGSQAYEGLDEVQQSIVENFENALTLRALLSSDEYLTGVDLGSLLDTGDGAFGHAYKGTWNDQQVVVKKFRDIEPPVF